MDATGLLEFLISCAWLLAVGLLLSHAFRQSKLFRRIPVAESLKASTADRVMVVIPARNEASNIGRCVESLLVQRYPADRLSIVVVDDHSTDDTAAVVRSIARRNERLSLLQSPPLLEGWIGKSHACWTAARDVSFDVTWICFMDADVWAEPDLISSAVQCAARDRTALLSLAPRQELKSFAERLILPCGHYLLAFCEDLEKRQRPDSLLVNASGQFMLLLREAYDATAGHAAVATAICEDTALARLLVRGGWKVAFHSGDHLLASRMYTGWRTLWPGFAKNIVEMLGGVRRTLALAFAAVVLSWAAVTIPLIDIATCRSGSMPACTALFPALFGSAAAFALHIAGALHFGIPLWYGLIFPLGYTAGAAIALDSIRRRWVGRVSWKGRVYS